jgi:alpha-glucosidase
MNKKQFLLVLLLWFYTQICLGEWNYVGKITDKYTIANNNEIHFQCENAKVIIQICDKDIVRVRMRKEGSFLPDEPYVVIKYDWSFNEFSIKDLSDYFEIKTERIIVKVIKSPFLINVYEEDGNPVCLDFKEGGLGFDDDKVICRKELSPSDHFFGLGQRYEKSDLRGMKKELWLTENSTPIPFFMATNGYGIFFHNTWKSTFDFTGNPYSFSSPGGNELDYYFFYGPDFKHILNLYTNVTGKSPLPPKWAFGMYFSKYGSKPGLEQGGQEGILKDVADCRNDMKWPLDVVRIHSAGCNQNFWASPSLSWGIGKWGSFPSVDRLINQLHALNCQAIFWESPGIMNDCKMYHEGASQGYYIMKNDEIWNGSFGSGLSGAILDFSNPDARNWWGTFHKYMVDAGADGIAGDHGEEVKDNMYSTFSNLQGEEYHNLYAMLYNSASWEAYKKYNPNKRCISFGRSLWAGCQRYPMQGTQDSHEEEKHIHGEMMGAINFGLSGVPFRTFTDNASSGNSSSTENIPIIRLSQYLSLAVAGERTCMLWSGNQIADDNYRFYAKLKYRLMPYIYTYIWQTTQTGLPIMRAMVLENQNDTMSYNAYGQYLLGKELLYAPFWKDDHLEREIYLPAGEWIDFWNGNKYKGSQKIQYKTNSVNVVPIFVRNGAIIPQAPNEQLFMDQNTEYLEIHFYPYGISSFTLYEDDGISYDYEQGKFAKTLIKCTEKNGEIELAKQILSGNYTLPERKLAFVIKNQKNPISVKYNNVSLKKIDKQNYLEEKGYFYDEHDKSIYISLGEDIYNSDTKVKVEFSAN